jgi:hypothetical protein
VTAPVARPRFRFKLRPWSIRYRDQRGQHAANSGLDSDAARGGDEVQGDFRNHRPRIIHEKAVLERVCGTRFRHDISAVRNPLSPDLKRTARTDRNRRVGLGSHVRTANVVAVPPRLVVSHYPPTSRWIGCDPALV